MLKTAQRWQERMNTRWGPKMTKDINACQRRREGMLGTLSVLSFPCISPYYFLKCRNFFIILSLFLLDFRKMIFYNAPYWTWVRSSAGEHYLHTVGVTGSIPVAPTNFKLNPCLSRVFLLLKMLVFRWDTGLGHKAIKKTITNVLIDKALKKYWKKITLSEIFI